MRARLRLLWTKAPRRFLARRNASVCFARQAPDLGGFDVAGDNENGIHRRVEALVVGQRVAAIERLDLVAPADHRRAVGMVRKE